MDDDTRNLPSDPGDTPREAEPGPARAGTDAADEAKAGTPRRSAEAEEGDDRSLASDAAAHSGDELAEGARGETDRA
jgi:hypothetical protein